MTLVKIIRRMLSMNDTAWYIFIRGLQLACMMLFCSFLLLLHCEASMYPHTAAYMTAQALAENPAGILLLALILSACVEDSHC